MKSNLRKKLLINKPFQLSFIGYTIGMAIVLIGIFASANNYFFWKFTQKGLQLGLPADHVFFQFLNQQRSSMNMIFLVTSAITFVLLVVCGLFISNRIAGPLYRLTTQLKKMIKTGTPQEIKFRDKDYFPEIADVVNEYVQSKTK